MSGLGHCNKPDGMTEGDAKRGFSQAFSVLNRGNAPLLVEKLGFAAGNGEFTCEEGSLMFQPCGTCVFCLIDSFIVPSSWECDHRPRLLIQSDADLRAQLHL